MIKFSIIIPAFNEEESIKNTLIGLQETINQQYEIIVVNDGSTDQTKKILRQIKGIRIISHAENRGYGAALKSGIQQANGEYILIIDADGTYPIKDILQLTNYLDYDMVVGARIGSQAKIPLIRKPAKWCLNRLANYLTETKIPDLNSGLRLFKKDTYKKFINLLPDGFSFTTTITLSFLSNNYRIKYIPIDYYKRQGKSKIRPFKDTLNFTRLIIRTILYFDPLKIFIPIGLILFLSSLGILVLSWLLSENIMDVTTTVLFISAIQMLAIGMLADLIVKKHNN